MRPENTFKVAEMLKEVFAKNSPDDPTAVGKRVAVRSGIKIADITSENVDQYLQGVADELSSLPKWKVTFVTGMLKNILARHL